MLGACWLATALTLVAVASPAEAARLYRFINDSGQTEISHAVPNHLVRRGYEVVDSNTGRVVQVVEPQMTPAQIAAKEAREQRTQQCEQLKARVLNMYASLADIDYAESKTLESIDTRLANAEVNLQHLRNQQRDLEDRAARAERGGDVLSDILKGNIARAEIQIANLEQEMVLRKDERDDVRVRFEQDRQTFQSDSECRMIKDGVELDVVSMVADAESSPDLVDSSSSG